MITGLNHFTVLTDDLERSLAFYLAVLGLKQGRRPEFGFPGAWLYAGDRPVLHIVAGRGVPDRPAGVIDHVAFSATGLADVQAKLRERAVPFEVRPLPGWNVLQLFCLDPDGAKVELDFDGAEEGQVDGMKPSAPVLAPMTEADYAAFVDEAIAAYAADKVASGQWAQEESLELSRQAFGELLPAGLGTEDNHLFNVLDDHANTVGRLWIGVREQAGQRIAYIYDLRIEPESRRRGHATRALAAAENEARTLGLSGVGLHVFGHNPNARDLYEKLGYRATNISMFKAL